MYDAKKSSTEVFDVTFEDFQEKTGYHKSLKDIFEELTLYECYLTGLKYDLPR